MRVRVFFASQPDSETRARIAAAAAALGPKAAVPSDNYHLTLAFVGEVPPAMQDTLRRIGASQLGRAFSVRFDRYEHWAKPRVLVAAATDVPASLHELWGALHADLAKHHLALAPQCLRPHVTIGRKVSQAPVLAAMSAFDWRIRTFSLMQSTTADSGPRYTVVDTWRLLDEEAAR